ncbi:cytochrome P450 [Streptomyces sp. NPDC058256]|uniref:cytochrome P450 family protein n=1 Tax=Streptomyces sp. NPDC058256 TaxID=3346408 RepID=UPI0036E1E0E3
MTTPLPAHGCPFAIDATASDIHGEAAQLRALGPAAQVELPGGIQAWSITDPGLITRLLTDPRISKDAHRHWPAFINGEIPERWPLRIWVEVRNALTAYGDEHTRLRRLIGPAFSARRIPALAPAIAQITHRLLDDLEQHQDTDAPVDLRAHFVSVLPLLVVNTLLGVPHHLHNAFRDRIGDAFATDLTEEKATANYRGLYQLLEELVTTKRGMAGNDITSALLNAHDAKSDSRLSHQELLDSLLLLIGAGHETTVNLIDQAVVNLVTHPTQLALVQNGSATWADAVEETLRHQPPVANILLRFPTEDIYDPETGLSFDHGEPIIVNHAAAGRDPHIHADPDRFDVTRATSRNHQSFGVGAHYCLGAELARLEARIALPALFDRFPQLTLAVPANELRPLASFISNGHQEIPVHLGQRL